MKVVDLINILNQIGYDENTELTFSCTDGNTGQYYEIPFEEISFGLFSRYGYIKINL